MSNIDILAIKQKAEQWTKLPYDEMTQREVLELFKNEDALVDAFYRDLEFGTGGLRGVLGAGSNRMNIYTVAIASQGFANYLKRAVGCGNCNGEAGAKQGDCDTTAKVAEGGSQSGDKGGDRGEYGATQETPRPRIAIAYDVRNKSGEFALKTAEVFSANNFDVYMFTAMRPTPLLSFAVRYFGAVAGVMITASHNPKEYNGYKAYGSDGCQLVSPVDKEVIGEVEKIASYKEVKTSGGKGIIRYVDAEVDEAYLKELKKLENSSIDLDKSCKIVYSPLHGTGMTILPRALRDWGYKEVYPLPSQMLADPNFTYASSPNPEEKTAMQLAIDYAKSLDADIVMATDPDADRMGLAVKDSKSGEYELLNGNQTAVLLTDHIIRHLSSVQPNLVCATRAESITSASSASSVQPQKPGYVVKTIVTTELIKDIALSNNLKLYDVLTGFKYIGELIEKKKGEEVFVCGGEESFGFLLADFVRDKDAVQTSCVAAQMAAEAKKEGKTLLDKLSDIYKKYGLYSQSLLSISKKGVKGAEEIRQMMEKYRNAPLKHIGNEEVEKIIDYLDGYEGLPKSNVIQFFTKEGSKITVRPSGTEPKIKFYFEVKSKWNDNLDLKANEELNYKRIKKLEEGIIS